MGFTSQWTTNPRAMAFGAVATSPARIGDARSTATLGTTTGDKVDGAIASILMLDGVTNGAIYALLALALVLVFAVTRVIFIPQGSSLLSAR